jgi:DNA-binding IscR family transcriptional regulator
VELSYKSQYAILALLELAVHYHEDKPRQSRQIAEQYNIPDRYLEQLLATLRRGAWCEVNGGQRGGIF